MHVHWDPFQSQMHRLISQAGAHHGYLPWRCLTTTGRLSAAKTVRRHSAETCVTQIADNVCHVPSHCGWGLVFWPLTAKPIGQNRVHLPLPNCTQTGSHVDGGVNACTPVESQLRVQHSNTSTPEHLIEWEKKPVDGFTRPIGLKVWAESEFSG